MRLDETPGWTLARPFISRCFLLFFFDVVGVVLGVRYRQNVLFFLGAAAAAVSSSFFNLYCNRILFRGSCFEVFLRHAHVSVWDVPPRERRRQECGGLGLLRWRTGLLSLLFCDGRSGLAWTVNSAVFDNQNTKKNQCLFGLLCIENYEKLMATMQFW